MNRYTRLLHLLQTRFPDAQIDLIDDSAAHAGHAHAHLGGETHYRLRILDSSFQGRPALAIHREIFAAVKSETDGGLHSLVIETAKAP